MKLNVIIPVLNEEKTIKKIIKKVLFQASVEKIIIVDDGSSDKTLKIVSGIRGYGSRIQILTHKKNLGKGAAIRTALKELDEGYFLIQDGDLEYDPSQYSILLEKVGPNRAVYGSRLLVDINKHAYFRTYLGNVFITWIFNILYGHHLTDTYTCYKLLSVKVVREFNLRSNGFEIEAEITAKLAKKGIKIIEVPIKFRPRSYEQGKKIKAKDALVGIWTFLKIRFNW